MPDYKWPEKTKRKVIGTRADRIDAMIKASGVAKYAFDTKRPGMLYAMLLTSPHAHARVTSLDTSAAEAMDGVKAVEIVSKPGTEIQWAGTEIVGIAAVSETIARDAARQVKVEYEVLPHVVKEDDLAKAGDRAKTGGEQVRGEPDHAFQEAEVVSEGHYGIPVIVHCTPETHGQVVEWEGETIHIWPTTQGVCPYADEISQLLKIPIAQVHVHMDHMGGGFGSKFPADRWSVVAAQLAKKTGKPVKLFLDRATDVTIAGNRPSFFADIKVAAKKDGTITAWQSKSWSTGGFTGGGAPPLPYVFADIPNRRMVHTSVSLNTGGSRAFRAPNHPQASFLTCCALDDLAHRLGMDPMELLSKNAGFTARPAVYRAQLATAADLMDWKKRWHPRGDSGSGPVKRGLGVGLGTWNGAGQASQVRTTIQPDGRVEVETGSQDLGTGTRTIITMVAAESLALPMEAIRLNIGDSRYPRSESSGGSTTVGGTSSATRKSTLNALDKLFAAVSGSLGAPADQLEAVDGEIRVKGNPAKRLAWKAACAKLDKPIVEMGENNPRSPGGLNTGNVGGVQMADVSVDIETGIVKMNKLVAVQDCGMIINPKTAESVVYSACTMSIGAALYEERVMDAFTGRVLNPDMAWYKFTGIGDYGEIVVHLNMEPEHDQRGVVGLGEPPIVPGVGAIANAVANAIGVRVPHVPLTPDRVLAALERRA